MGRGKNKEFKQAETYNAAAAKTATDITANTTATGQYIAPRALARLKALDEKGSEELKGYELFNPEEFAERESQRRTGIETLNAPLVNPNYLAGVQEEMKDRRMRDRANTSLMAFSGARQRAMGEAYTAEGDTRSAMAIQMQGQLGAAQNQTQYASAYNQRKRWYDPVFQGVALAMGGAQSAAGMG